jgi:hypothetical protein
MQHTSQCHDEVAVPPLLRIAMITLLGCTGQVSERGKRIGLAHDAGMSSGRYETINA